MTGTVIGVFFLLSHIITIGTFKQNLTNNSHDNIKRRNYIMNSEKFHILFAEDDIALNMTLKEELTEAGYGVMAVFDGEEAMEVLKDKSIDVALLDIKMPRMNGIEVLKLIKANYPSIKVIMLTAYADLKNSMMCKKLGADGFVGKPYDLADLFTTIDRVLSN